MNIAINSKYIAEPDDQIIGYVGETESRTITITGYQTEGADLYKLRLEYDDGVAYDIDITSGTYVVQASILRKAGLIKAQILAVKVTDGNYEYVKKSQVFWLKICESLDGKVNVIPTFEQSQEMLEKVLSIGQNKTDISTVKTDIQNLQNQDNVLSSRIDNLSTLTEGSTTADAELLDIRVKADGTTATSAGNAVREQFSELKSDLSNIKSDLVNFVDPRKTKLLNLIDPKNIAYNKNLYYVVGESTPHSLYDDEGTSVSLNLIRVKKGDILYCGDNLSLHRFSLFVYNDALKLQEKVDQKEIYTVSQDGFAMINIWGCSNLSDLENYKTYLNVNKCFGYHEYGKTENDLTLDEYKNYVEIPIEIQNGYYIENTFYENEYYTSSKISCNPKEMFLVDCYLLGVSQMSVAIFLDANESVIGKTEVINLDTHIYWYPVETPNKCRYIIVNNRKDKGVRLRVKKFLPRTGTNFSNLKGGFTGDSICYGLAYEGGYAKVLSEKYGLRYNNIGVSGGHIAEDRKDVFIISNSIGSLDSDIDFLIMEGGINDYSNYVTVGELTNGYSDEINPKTFFGGLEKLFRDAVARFPFIPKAFLIVHKVNDSCIKTDDIHRTEYPSGEIITFDFFVDCIYKAARKYGIKIIDVNNNSAFDTYNSTLKSIYTGNDGDGLHPNRDGYEKFYVPLLKEWIQSIVID